MKGRDTEAIPASSPQAVNVIATEQIQDII